MNPITGTVLCCPRAASGNAHGHGHFVHHFNFKRNFVHNFRFRNPIFLSGFGWGGVGVWGPMTILGAAATPLL
jgi:hypothetical protein